MNDDIDRRALLRGSAEVALLAGGTSVGVGAAAAAPVSAASAASPSGDALHADAVTDTVSPTGDIHSSWAADLPLDDGSYPATPSVATEFVATSVTSDSLDDILAAPPRTTSRGVEAALQAADRPIRYLEFDSRGASVLDVSTGAVQRDWSCVSDRTRPDATVALGRSFRTRTGTQQVEPAGSPVPSAPRR